jgi:hypothetical protein
MHTNGNASRLLDAGRTLMRGSRWWVWLAATAVAGTTAAYLTAAAGQPVSNDRPAGTDRHVTVVASSGDTGAISDQGPPEQVSLPASDPLVLAVGGTAPASGPCGASPTSPPTPTRPRPWR